MQEALVLVLSTFPRRPPPPLCSSTPVSLQLCANSPPHPVNFAFVYLGGVHISRNVQLPHFLRLFCGSISFPQPGTTPSHHSPSMSFICRGSHVVNAEEERFPPSQFLPGTEVPPFGALLRE